VSKKQHSRPCKYCISVGNKTKCVFGTRNTERPGIMHEYRFSSCWHDVTMYIYNDTSAARGVLLMLRVPRFHYCYKVNISGVAAGAMQAWFPIQHTFRAQNAARLESIYCRRNHNSICCSLLYTECLKLVPVIYSTEIYMWRLIW
jgi:hypothetical protein